MATIRPPQAPPHRVEAEPVLVDLDGDAVTLVLDDGTELCFVRSELRDALSERPTTAA
jgi:hypothetical protein